MTGELQKPKKCNKSVSMNRFARGISRTRLPGAHRVIKGQRQHISSVVSTSTRLLKVPWAKKDEDDNDRHVQVHETNCGDYVDQWINAHFPFLSSSSSSAGSSSSVELEQIKAYKEMHIIGFDMEWTPSFKKGSPRKTSLVQLTNSAATEVLLYRCNLLHDPKSEATFPSSLTRLIQSDIVVKTGVGVFADLQKLCNDFDFYMLSGAYNDIGIATSRLSVDNLLRPTRFNMESISTHMFGDRVKAGKAVTMSNWDTPQLTDKQIKYAALDALISIDVHRLLEEHGVFSDVMIESAVMQAQTVNDGNPDQTIVHWDAGQVSRRKEFRYFFNQSREGSRIILGVARLIRFSDNAHLKNLITELTSNATANPRSGRKYRDMVSALFSRFSGSASFKYNRNAGNVVASVMYNYHVVEVAHAPNKTVAVENACKAVCMKLLTLQQELELVPWMYACAGIYQHSPSIMNYLSMSPDHTDSQTQMTTDKMVNENKSKHKDKN